MEEEAFSVLEFPFSKKKANLKSSDKDGIGVESTLVLVRGKGFRLRREEEAFFSSSYQDVTGLLRFGSFGLCVSTSFGRVVLSFRFQEERGIESFCLVLFFKSSNKNRYCVLSFERPLKH